MEQNTYRPRTIQVVPEELKSKSGEVHVESLWMDVTGFSGNWFNCLFGLQEQKLLLLQLWLINFFLWINHC